MESAMSTRPLVGQRALTLVEPSGAEREVTVTVWCPTGEVNRTGWTCEYRVSGVDDERVHEVRGADGIQAVQLALETVVTRLNYVAQQRGAVLRWKYAPEGDLGFQTLFEREG